MDSNVGLAGSPGFGIDHGESTLIEAAQKDPAAFAVLYNHYMPRVYRYLRSRSNSDEDAADLTQQVFLQALDALPRYRDRGLPFAAWLFSIARNAAREAHRRHKITVNYDFIPEALQSREDAGPEEVVLQREVLDRLRTLLLELSPEKRELLALRFFAGLTAAEAGAVVGKSEASVHKQLSRTLQTLKEQYRAQ